MPIIIHVINIYYFFNFDKSDKMRPCDLLLAGVMETFSPKSDHSMEVNCEEKYHFLFFVRRCSPIKLQNDTVLLFEQRGAKKKQGGAPPCLLSLEKPLHDVYMIKII